MCKTWSIKYECGHESCPEVTICDSQAKLYEEENPMMRLKHTGLCKLLTRKHSSPEKGFCVDCESREISDSMDWEASTDLVHYEPGGTEPILVVPRKSEPEWFEPAQPEPAGFVPGAYVPTWCWPDRPIQERVSQISDAPSESMDASKPWFMTNEYAPLGGYLNTLRRPDRSTEGKVSEIAETPGKSGMRVVKPGWYVPDEEDPRPDEDPRPYEYPTPYKYPTPDEDVQMLDQYTQGKVSRTSASSGEFTVDEVESGVSGPNGFQTLVSSHSYRSSYWFMSGALDGLIS